MDLQTLKLWRRAERERLVAERLELDEPTLEAWRRRIDATIESEFPQLARKRIVFCWPIRNEYDARHLMRRLRAGGALSALPVVQAPGAPLLFRKWHPGVRLERGPLGIPYPVDSAQVVPEAALLPMNGWDAKGYRLGYGGGFFDRTLAALATRPIVIGISYEQARIETIRPQPWDIAMDFVVTERGAYRRSEKGLLLMRPER